MRGPASGEEDANGTAEQLFVAVLHTRSAFYSQPIFYFMSFITCGYGYCKSAVTKRVTSEKWANHSPPVVVVLSNITIVSYIQEVYDERRLSIDYNTQCCFIHNTMQCTLVVQLYILISIIIFELT